jgi:hypothetical protein
MEDENAIWKRPFATPMADDAFKFVTRIIVEGHTGGFIWGPTRTGKTSLTKLIVNDVTKIMDYRSNIIVSASLRMDVNYRWVMSEGGFWNWQLHQFRHHCADAKDNPQKKRHLAYEYLKGVAAGVSSGRVVIVVDEAQLLELVELGLFADLFNELERDGFQLIVIFVGSYEVTKWKKQLQGREHSHVRSRFFTNEHRLRGLTSVEDYRRCLKRYDIDTRPLEGTKSITQYFQPEWHAGGGRLEPYAAMFKAAFTGVVGDPRVCQVPMGFFRYVVQNSLNRRRVVISPTRLRHLVLASGFRKELHARPR